MTSEHRIVFCPSDIRGIAFECGDCKGRIVVTGGNDVRHGDEIVNCPSCGKRWLADYTGANVYRKFLVALAGLRDAQADEPRPPFNVAFEIDAPGGSGD